MAIHFSDLYRRDGTLDREPFALWGLALFLLKSQLDRLIAYRIFHRPWSFWGYLVPGESQSINGVPKSAQAFYLTLVAIALPFVYIGIVMTVRRLRSAVLSVWLVVYFFVPVVNLVFFLLLCVLPALDPATPEEAVREARRRPLLDYLIPDSTLGSAVAGVVTTVALSVVGTLVATELLHGYGWGLFIGLPFCLGLTTTLIYGYHARRSLGECVAVSLLALAISGTGLLFLAMEGLGCLVMAAPLAVPLVILGAVVGCSLQPMRSRQTDLAIVTILLFTPGYMTAEHLKEAQPPTLQVVSSVEIDAPPEKVWKQVIGFTPLPPPQEFLFRAGIAYPMHATITGHGPGAVRRCLFSTGPFVEPIKIWDEPRLLKFDVTENPAPMQEWTIYSAIHPTHLHGFLVSSGGQFLLTPLPGNRTRLEGTTWYRHSMWPVEYWRIWSDYIIHRIHMRVLDHVKVQSEAQDD